MPSRSLPVLPLVALGLLLAATSSCEGGCCGPERGGHTVTDTVTQTPVAPTRSSCKIDSDCGGDQTCFAGTCTAKVTKKTFKRGGNNVPHWTAKENSSAGCKRHDACAAGELCTDGECSPAGACTSSSECPPGGECDADLGKCRSTICFDDKMCGDSLHCVYGRCQQERPVCVSSSDCTGGSVCSSLYGVCETWKCTEDNDCAGPRRCHKGLCWDCAVDDDCPGTQTCLIPGRRCVEPATCASNDDCLKNKQCNADSGKCETPVCTPDNFGDNHARDVAGVLQQGEYTLNICDEREDWFVFNGDEGDGIRLHVEYDPNLYGLRLETYVDESTAPYRYFDDGQRAGSILGTMDSLPATGSYYLKVKQGGLVGQPYRLRLDVIKGGFCDDDMYEPDDHPENARDISVERDRVHRLCNGTHDWLKVPVAEGETMSVRFAVIDGPPVDTEIVLLSESGTRTSKRFAGTKSAVFDVVGTPDGHVLLHISASEGQQGNATYSITTGNSQP